MRALLLIASALVLGACASKPPQTSSLAGTAPAQGIVLLGTLAPLGSFEWKAAPTYTGVAALRQRAATQLRQGRIDAGAARDVQRRADNVRATLDDAVKLERSGQAALAEALLALAEAALKDAEAYLAGRVK